MASFVLLLIAYCMRLWAFEASCTCDEGVVGGAVAGHGVATAIAILGGNVLSKYVSEKTVQYM